jgi:hypothetical protein
MSEHVLDSHGESGESAGIENAVELSEPVGLGWKLNGSVARNALNRMVNFRVDGKWDLSESLQKRLKQPGFDGQLYGNEFAFTCSQARNGIGPCTHSLPPELPGELMGPKRKFPGLEATGNRAS